MASAPHVDLDLGDLNPRTASEQAFESLSSKLDDNLTRLTDTLSTAQTLLSRRNVSAPTLTPHMDSLDTLTSSVRRDLSSLAALNKATAADPQLGPASLRIRVTRFSAYSKRFSAYLTEYEDAREAYRQVLDKDVRSGLAQVDPSLDSAAVDDAMSRAGGLDAVLQRANPDLKWQVRDILERNSQLTKLNGEVARLHEMFTELSSLTENQQGLINDIETNVEHVKIDVKKADEEILEAHKYQKSARKKKMIIAIILLLILIAIAVVVVIVVT